MLYPALLAVSVSAPSTLGKGFVGQKFVNTLFDSGANIIGINKKKTRAKVCIHRKVHKMQNILRSS